MRRRGGRRMLKSAGQTRFGNGRRSSNWGPGDPDTISISIKWQRSQPNAFWIDLNGEPLTGQLGAKYGAELDHAGFILREVARGFE